MTDKSDPIAQHEDFSVASVRYKNGGNLGISAMPGLTKNLEHDLDIISDWHATVVVTMTTTHELQRAEVFDLERALETRGIEHLQIPVPNYDGLSGQNALAWPAISLRLHEILQASGRVLVHCRGGHGRSGMIVMRLLVENGMAPQEALKTIRRVRPGAVETQAQYLWAATDDYDLDPATIKSWNA